MIIYRSNKMESTEYLDNIILKQKVKKIILNKYNYKQLLINTLKLLGISKEVATNNILLLNILSKLTIISTKYNKLLINDLSNLDSIYNNLLIELYNTLKDSITIIDNVDEITIILNELEYQKKDNINYKLVKDKVSTLNKIKNIRKDNPLTEISNIKSLEFTYNIRTNEEKIKTSLITISDVTTTTNTDEYIYKNNKILSYKHELKIDSNLNCINYELLTISQNKNNYDVSFTKNNKEKNYKLNNIPKETIIFDFIENKKQIYNNDETDIDSIFIYFDTSQRINKNNILRTDKPLDFYIGGLLKYEDIFSINQLNYYKSNYKSKDYIVNPNYDLFISKQLIYDKTYIYNLINTKKHNKTKVKKY